MSSSARIYTCGSHAGRRSADLQVAWLDAAEDAYEAYLAWREADRRGRDEAFVVYHAALDPEQAAARALELEITGRPTCNGLEVPQTKVRARNSR